MYTKYKKEIAIRTFLYYNAVLVYLFTANIWTTIGVTLAMELLFSFVLFLHIKYERVKQPDPVTTFIIIDTCLAFVVGFFASFVYVLVEYVFDAAAFIGDSRLVVLSCFLLALQIIRYALLLVINHMYLIFAVCVTCLPVFILFTILMTNEAFWADAHTAVVATTYVLLTVPTLTLMSLGIAHYAYVVHAVLLAIVLGSCWSLRSERDFSSYMS